MNYDWDLSVLLSPSVAGALVTGFGVSILLTFWGVVLGTPLGFLIGALASTGNATRRLFGDRSKQTSPSQVFLDGMSIVTRVTAVAYIDIVRSVPLLLTILISYYGLPLLVASPLIKSLFYFVGLGNAVVVTPFQASAVALIVNLSAFVADLVRGSVAGAPRGAVIAAMSLGMDDWLVWRRVLLPDVIREIFPSLTMLWITIFKMSTLASTVTVYEVLHSADAMIQRTFKPLEVYLAVCLLFVLTVIPLAVLARRLERTQLLRRRSSA